MAPVFVIPSKISEYYILPISLPALPSNHTPATHYLYLRPHEPKIPSPTTSRSLFLVNVPFDATNAHIKHLFSQQMDLPSGRIENVEFESTRSNILRPETEKLEKFSHPQAQPGKKNNKKRKRGADVDDFERLEDVQFPTTWDRQLHKSGSTVVVVFVDRASMEAVIKAVKRLRKRDKDIVWGEGLEGKLPALGSASMGYLTHQRLRYPDKAQLLESVNSYMTAFAAQESARARLLARQRQQPDEEGFITVTRGGRTGPARQREAQEKAEKQKDKQKGLEDFYRFQTREKKKARAGELIKRFEEDKEKVRSMRERRGRFRVRVLESY
ncbi:Ribosomal RNA-processing protein 7 [Lignoscripta atroalba]|nr:Ribosomal RNA-processing protein 7 [Lignoscripta atroalba]